MKTRKQTIRLTEADLHRVIKESVKRALTEEYDKNDEIENEYTQELTSQMKRFCDSDFKINYLPYKDAYVIHGKSGDDSVWSNFLFLMMYKDLKIISNGRIGPYIQIYFKLA